MYVKVVPFLESICSFSSDVCWCVNFAWWINDKQRSKRQTTTSKELQPLCLNKKKNYKNNKEIKIRYDDLVREGENF